MPTAKEIRTEWKTIRSALGNLICYIEGKTEELYEIEQIKEKEYERGHEEGYRLGWSDCEEFMSKHVKTNADVFTKAFPGITSVSQLVKVIKDASERNGIMRSEWWDEPYKSPGSEDGE